MKAINYFSKAATLEEIAEKIKWLEGRGFVDPDCDYCKKTFYPHLRETGEMRFAPTHKAMSGCRSGGRDHCTCDGCF